MILARWNGEWAIAQRLRDGASGCSLSVRNAVGPKLQSCGFEPYNYKTFWHKYFPSVEEIVFYPEIYYRGCRVSPQYWQRESAEPILNCFLQPEDIGVDLLGGAAIPDYVREYPEFHRLVRADGWAWDAMDGGTRYIHVDDLEKIEGPPPEGPF